MQNVRTTLSKLSTGLKSASKQKVILIAVFIVALFVLGGYYSMAKSKFKPVGILNSSFGENTFTVSWFTDWKTTGSIEVADNKDFKNSMVFEDVRDYDVNGTKVASQPRNSHVVIARKLNPQTKYYYRVQTQYNDTFNQSYQTVTTPKVAENVQTPNPIYGEVVDKAGKGIENVLVEIYAKENDGVESSRLITYTQKNGTYSADISNLRRNNIDEFWTPTEGISYKYVITARTNTESYFVETKDELTPVKTFAFESVDGNYSQKDNSLMGKLVGKASAQTNTCQVEKKAAEQCFADYNYCNSLKGKTKPMKERAAFPGDTAQIFDDSKGPESCYSDGARKDLLDACKSKETEFNSCVSKIPTNPAQGNPNNQGNGQAGEPIRKPSLSNQTKATQNGCTYYNDNEVFKCEGPGIARAYDATCTTAKHTYANGACDNYGGKSNPGAGDKCKAAVEKGEKCQVIKTDPETNQQTTVVVTPTAKPARVVPNTTGQKPVSNGEPSDPTPTQANNAASQPKPRCDKNVAINNGKQTECSSDEVCRVKGSSAVCEAREQSVPVQNTNNVAPASTQCKGSTSANGASARACTTSSGSKGYCASETECVPQKNAGDTCNKTKEGECASPYQCQDNGKCALSPTAAPKKKVNEACQSDAECPTNTKCTLATGGKYCMIPATPTPTPKKPVQGDSLQVLSPLNSISRFNAKSNQVVKTGETVDPGLYTSPGGTTLDLQAPTKVTFFVDANGNGKRDANEQVVTDQAYQLVKQQDAFTYNVLNGWNALNFPFYKSDTTMYKASELVEEAAKQGIVIETIKAWDGNWVDYTKKGDKTYTADFTIYPNRGYFIKATVKGTFNVFGTTPTEALPVQMLNGWTLVGVAPGYTQNKEKVYKQAEFRDGITAFEFIRTANKANPAFALDNMTKYDSGVYRGVNYSKNASGSFIEFGLDFSVENLESYFVRSYSKNIFTP